VSAEIRADAPELSALIAHWLEAGAVTPEALDRARGAAERSGGRIDQVTNRLGLVSDEAFAEGWAAVTGWPLAEDFPAAPIELPSVPNRFLIHARLVVLASSETSLVVATGDPLDRFSLRALGLKTGRTIEPRIARPATLQLALDRLAALASSPSTEPQVGLASDVDRLRDLASDAPAIRAIETTIDRAVEAGASDIHVLPTAEGARLRVRVDGVLRDLAVLPRDLAAAFVSRLKVMAQLDIAESRLPQDGRLRVPHRGVELDLRMATVPQVHGEGAVLRVLHRARATPELEALGLPEEVLSGLARIIASPNGLLLVTGPTGSGKTTTLYATLGRLARPDRNIITVEDPVEHGLDGAAQIQVDRRIGFDFAQALRAVLRHDPDVVMIGEIRDGETAAIAVRAALTGHLVLATVHTSSAADAIPRLIDMGIEPWLLGSTLRGAMAQRLLRRLCGRCRVPAATGFGFAAVGCPSCLGSGYRGRVAIGEFVEAEALQRPDGSDTVPLRLAPHRTLQDDARRRVAAGETSAQEVERVLGLSVDEGVGR
jgi:general secretion pathway protein E